MLRGTCINSYPKNGRKIFVYKVTGTKEEVAEYLELQRKRSDGKFSFEDEDGNALYWTSSPSGRTINLNITTNGNIVEDTTNLDLEASAKARFDHTYDTVRTSLKGQSGPVITQQPAAANAGAAGKLDDEK